MASFVFNAGSDGLTDGTIDWAADTIKARLISDAATPNKDDDDLASGYTAIGTDQTLGSKTRAKDDSTDRVKYDAADATFPSVTLGSTVGFVVIYKDDGGNGIPIALLDISNTPTNGGNILIQFGAAGIFYLQQ